MYLRGFYCICALCVKDMHTLKVGSMCYTSVMKWGEVDKSVDNPNFWG